MLSRHAYFTETASSKCDAHSVTKQNDLKHVNKKYIVLTTCKNAQPFNSTNNIRQTYKYCTKLSVKYTKKKLILPETVLLMVVNLFSFDGYGGTALKGMDLEIYFSEKTELLC